MVASSLFTRLSSAILLNETIFNYDDLIIKVSKLLVELALAQKMQAFFLLLVVVVFPSL